MTIKSPSFLFTVISARIASKRSWSMTVAAAALVIAVAIVVGVLGCGGGGSARSRLTQKQIRKRAIASARLTRGTFAIAGIGRQFTRAAIAVRPRLRAIVTAVRRTRDVNADFDADLGLYFVVQSELDGSGHQFLFSDASHNIPAGSFAWTAPPWKNGQKDTYPSQIHTDYTIRGGAFSGEHGTIDFVADDSSGNNGTMHVVMTTQESESVVAEFDVLNGVVKGRNKCTLPDGTTWVQVDSPLDNGGINTTIDFQDGYVETITTDSDGNATQSITGPDGYQEANGTLGSDGLDKIEYGDGSVETVDVNTGDAGDGGGSGDTGSNSDSNNGSDDGSNQDRHVKTHSKRRN